MKENRKTNYHGDCDADKPKQVADAHGSPQRLRNDLNATRRNRKEGSVC